MRRFFLFLLGMMLGVMVGVALAMLLAPASGDRMRQEAREYYEQLLAEARQAAEARRQELERELKQMTGAAEADAGS